MSFLDHIKRSRLTLPVAFLMAVLMLLFSEISYREAVDKIDQLDEIRTMRTNIRNLLQAIVDAETGQRGYLLTDDKEYLQPYLTGSREIGHSLQLLNQYFSRHPEAKEIIKKLNAAVETKQSEIVLIMQLHDQGKNEQGRELMLSGIGKENMDAIRVITAQLLEYEGRKYEQSRENISGILIFNRIGVGILTIISFFGLYYYLKQRNLLENRRLELQEKVKAERDRLEVIVAQRTSQLIKLTHHLQSVREDERNRLARDLHDELGALLTSAKLDAARIRSRLANTAPEATERLNHLVEVLNSGIEMKRRIIEDLRPSTLSHLGLIPTLEIQARDFAQRSGIEVHCDLTPVKLAADTELVIYRLVQEAITNITKYAKAHNVWINMASHAGQVEISVRDDGIGFDPNTPSSSAYGLVGMRFRVEAEGGTMKLLSSPGQGTLIQVKLPESVTAPA